jgi:autoinducer 2 (AI-2) kinase
MAHLLTIDAGTGSVRASVFGGGEPLATAVRPWRQQPDPRVPGSLDFDTTEGWRLLCEAVRESLATAGVREVRAVGVASARGGIVVLDRDGTELFACGAVDARATDEVRAIRSANPEFERQAYLRTGQTLGMAAGPRLLWLREHRPEIFRRAACVEMVSDWVVTRLTGEFAAEPSNACTTGLLDLATRDWAPDLLDALELSGDLLPPVHDPGAVVGRVSARGAEDTGLAVGTPVVTAGGDAQVASLGLGVVDPGAAAVVGGSFWQQLVDLESPATDPDMRVRVTCHVVPSAWQADALVFRGGLAVDWFVRAFGGPLDRRGHREALDRLEREAARVERGSRGALALFANTMDYGRWRQAAPAFVGIPADEAEAAPGVLFRALLEGIAIAARGNLELIAEATGSRLPEEVVFGGGAARSGLWARILADVLGRPVRLPALTEATSAGAAILAGLGAGIHSDVREAARSVVAWRATVEPDPAGVERYRDVAARWRAAYDSQLRLVDDGVTAPLWTAAGG